MKIFLDANILISVLNKEYPVFTYSSRVLSLADHKRFRVYTSPLCLAIAFYFAEKKTGNASARHRISLLAQKLYMTRMDSKTVTQVLENKMIHDLEDGMQYYSAIDSGCQCIVTENKSDFYFSKIEVLSSHDFLQHYLF
ncbi:MAG: PIN domain-containing protein [Bacteroidetes bacterium]|nr:PIN domain-containing protein [Bacteroidota bacterium]